MRKNLILGITQMLGVNIGEEFKVKVNNPYETHLENLIFMFDEKQGLVMPSENYCSTKTSINVFVRLMCGEYDIVKLPWKPKIDDKYWSYIGPLFAVDWGIWGDRATELSRLKCGIIFRTKAEAIKERPRIYKELTGKILEKENG